MEETKRRDDELFAALQKNKKKKRIRRVVTVLVIVGLIAGALAAAVGSHAGRVEADITPLFGENDLCVDLTGMIRTRSGQIMNAIAMSGIDSISRRIAKWTDTRLKA